MPEFIDIADFDEDRRIEMIGKAAMLGQVVCFITDSDPGKADRYMSKMKTMFPYIHEIERAKGPVNNTVTVKVRRMTAQEAAERGFNS